MKSQLHITKLKICFFILSCLLCANSLVAQQQSAARPYVLYSNDKLEISSSTSITGGAIASKTLIKTTGNSVLSTKIQSGGRLELNNGNTVDSVITVANSQKVSGTIMQVGSNALIKNKVDVIGNTVIAGGTVKGPVSFDSTKYTYSGPPPANGFGRNPSAPVPPALPSPTNFSAPDTGRRDITSGVITPGVYRNLIPNGGKTITFSGTGTYIFHSIKNSGSFNNYVFDFGTNKKDLIRIYVYAEVDVYKVNPSFLPSNTVNGASRIYMEVKGTGGTTGVAWSISNGASGNTRSIWQGTVYAPNGNINVGQGSSEAKIIGALWSGKQITVQSGVNVIYSPLLNDDVIVPFNPIAGFKYSTVIGAELTSITQGITDEAKRLLFISDDGLSILIDVIAINGHQTEVYNYLIAHGMTGIIPNGVNILITTGYYPIANLLELNNHGDIIDFCQPVYRPLGNSGLIINDGDTAIGTHLVRNGYNLQGTGVKVGVISDSYNSLVTSTDDPVARDIATGELPGPGNPVNSTPVQIVSPPPYPSGADEGRAMLQIVHDIAPKAQLYFRTGFRSPGDFAAGIRELQQVGCNVIVDDITYINEPFLQDGPVARMVDSVKNLGVSYFTSAGNFSNSSHGQVFNPVDPPVGFPAGTKAHDFRGTGTPDIYQRLRLTPGSYTIALQWEDSIYSTGITHTGTSNDFDIYLTDTSGNIICGYNRDNTLNMGGDPFEFLAYTVLGTNDVEANILITRANIGTPTPRFKYIIFRGGATIMEYQSDASTIVGQANAAGAIAVAAINYFRTPAFPWPSPDRLDSIAYYSSIGGTLIDSAGRLVDRHKPDITAPDGVNTSVNMGGDLPSTFPSDNDPFSNFFGTSAAAPHAAATAALLIEGRSRFLPSRPFTPDSVKLFLQRSALRIPGFSSYAQGAGLIQADVTMRTFASPRPRLDSLEYPSSITPLTPPTDSFTLIVHGNYFTDSSAGIHRSEILFRGTAIPTTFVNQTVLTARLPGFIGNPTVQVYTPPIAVGDGDTSVTRRFFSINKKTVSIKADDKTKKYGEQLPVFTSVIRVNGVRLDSSGLSLQDVGLQNLTYATNATPLSNIGNQYFIKPVRTFDSTNATDLGLLELYNYDTIPGILTITQLPVQIIPDSQVITYGDSPGPITFTYKIDSAIVAANPAVVDIIRQSHQQLLAPNVIGVIGNSPIGIIPNGGLRVAISNGTPITITNGGLRVAISNTFDTIPIYNYQSVTGFNGTSIGSATIVPYVLSDAELANLSFFASDSSILHARLLMNTNIVDVPQQSLLEYRTKPDSTIIFNTIANSNSRGILGAGSLAATANGGLRVAISNGGGLRVAISNVPPYYVIPNGGGLRVAISNSGSFVITNGGLRVAISNSFDSQANKIPGIPVIVDSTDFFHPVDGLNIKSLNVITGLTAGLQKIIPGTALNDNYKISYGLGNLRIRPATLTVKANDVSKRYLDPNPPLTVTYTGFKNGERIDSSDVTGVPTVTTTVTQTTNVGTYPIVVGLGTLTSSNYTFAPPVNGTFTVLNNPCLLTRAPFTNFGSTPIGPTSLWVNVEAKVSGQLKSHGKYLLFTGGSIVFNDIMDPVTKAPIPSADIPNGKIIADTNIKNGKPYTIYDLTNKMWITRVPVPFSSTSDIFLTGAIINSPNGFVKKKNNANSSTVLKGILYSDTTYTDQWTYAIAAYSPIFDYPSIAAKDSVVAINGNYRAGTPIPQISHIVNGGSGGGGNNYTGSTSSYDNFTACLVSGTSSSLIAGVYNLDSYQIQSGLSESMIRIVPNPATNYITLSFVPGRSGKAEIVLYNIDGRKISETFSGHYESGKKYNQRIDVSKLINGIYLVQLRSADKITTKKIIISR
jgi:hypothetical protein